MDTTRISSKGQVVIPARIRKALGLKNGQKLLVEVSEGNVLLKPDRLFPETTVDDVYGCLHYDGPAKSLEDMERAIAEGAHAQTRID